MEISVASIHKWCKPGPSLQDVSSWKDLQKISNETKELENVEFDSIYYNLCGVAPSWRLKRIFTLHLKSVNARFGIFIQRYIR